MTNLLLGSISIEHNGNRPLDKTQGLGIICTKSVTSVGSPLDISRKIDSQLNWCSALYLSRSMESNLSELNDFISRFIFRASSTSTLLVVTSDFSSDDANEV